MGYKIISKRKLNDTVTQMDILAPYVAAKAEAGQFIILRVTDDGERIPLTVAGFDREKGCLLYTSFLRKPLSNIF